MAKDYTAKIPHPKRGQHVKQVSNGMKRLNGGRKYITPKNASGSGRPRKVK